MTDIAIYHNPACGTSRNTLALIRHAGIEPDVVEYLRTPPTKDELRDLIARMGIPVRALLREKGTPYAELHLGEPTWTDDQLRSLSLHRSHPVRPCQSCQSRSGRRGRPEAPSGVAC